MDNEKGTIDFNNVALEVIYLIYIFHEGGKS
jgi:hypothetical protein